MDPERIVYRCQSCGVILFDKYIALMHVKSVHTAPDWIIQMGEGKRDILQSTDNDAKEKINNHQTLSTKLQGFSISSILQCEFCDFLLLDITELREHTMKHDPQCGFRCHCCITDFKTAPELISHWQTICLLPIRQLVDETSIKLHFACVVCEKLFDSIELLHEHKYANMHYSVRWCQKLGKNKINCEICGLLEDTPEAMKKHQAVTHTKINEHASKDKRQLLCHICGKIFYHTSHMKDHLVSHEDVRPVKCPEEN